MANEEPKKVMIPVEEISTLELLNMLNGRISGGLLSGGYGSYETLNILITELLSRIKYEKHQITIEVCEYAKEPLTENDIPF